MSPGCVSKLHIQRTSNVASPLDASAVHPERYALVERIARDVGVEPPQLIGNQELVDKIDFSKYSCARSWYPTSAAIRRRRDSCVE